MDKAVMFSLIKRYSSDQGLVSLEDPMIVEIGLDIFVNDQFYKKIYCSPINIDELIIGSLAFDNMINSVKDISKLHIGKDRAYVDIQVLNPQDSMSCEKIAAENQVDAQDIARLMKQHLDASDIHRQTGGVHIMSLSEGKSLMVSREDIGRHNAVDKIYGYCLKNNLDCSRKILFSSGRISNEIIEKICFMGVKIVVSRATVTDLARKKAEDAGITLIGFARGERFNIYSHPERIIINDRR